MKYQNNAVRIVTWKEVKNQVFEVNPELAEILDACKPGAEHLLVKVSYPFGSHIIKSGTFYLPNEHGVLSPFSSVGIPNEFKEMFAYHWGSIPFGILLSGVAESFWTGSEQIISMGILPRGGTFALRTIFDEDSWCNFKDAFDLTAGSRLLFLLPSIKDNTKFKKLIKAIGKRCSMPRDFDEQWNLFKDIYLSEINNDGWQSELLLFTKPWLEDMLSGKFHQLSMHLRKKIWSWSEFWRNRKLFDFIWSDFIRIAKHKGVKVKDYIFDFARHLILIGVGDEYGFSPATDDTFAPIELFRDAFIGHYKISFDPTFMRSDTIRWGQPKKIYFSLQHPSNLLTYPHRHTNNSSLDDVRDVKTLVDLFKECASQGKIGVGGTRFTELENKIKYDYYHTDRDYSNQVLSSGLIVHEDTRFQSKEGLEFCSSSQFFKGCVRITSL